MLLVRIKTHWLINIKYYESVVSQLVWFPFLLIDTIQSKSVFVPNLIEFLLTWSKGCFPMWNMVYSRGVLFIDILSSHVS